MSFYHSVFVYKTRPRLVILIVYVNDINFSSTNLDGIKEVENKLETFQKEDLG